MELYTVVHEHVTIRFSDYFFLQ